VVSDTAYLLCLLFSKVLLCRGQIKHNTEEEGHGTYGREEKCTHGLVGKPEGWILSGRSDLPGRIIWAKF
jgi:hypothetical protein